MMTGIQLTFDNGVETEMFGSELALTRDIDDHQILFDDPSKTIRYVQAHKFQNSGFEGMRFLDEDE